MLHLCARCKTYSHNNGMSVTTAVSDFLFAQPHNTGISVTTTVSDFFLMLAATHQKKNAD